MKLTRRGHWPESRPIPAFSGAPQVVRNMVGFWFACMCHNCGVCLWGSKTLQLKKAEIVRTAYGSPKTK